MAKYIFVTGGVVSSLGKGITGALLAVPLAAAIQITLAHIPTLAPLAVLMGSGKRYAKKNPPPEPRTADELPADRN